MKGYLRHSFEFILVISILIIAIFLLEFFKSYTLRLIITSFLTLLYISVGIFHHWEEKNLRANQVFEHIAVGALIFVILASLYLKHF